MMTELTQIAQLVVTKFSDKPDDFTTTLGTWGPDTVLGHPHQDFTSYLAIPMSDWRRYASSPPARVGGPTVCSASFELLKRYGEILGTVGPSPAPQPGCGIEHLLWMCATALENGASWPVDKLSRWLGFIQGVMTTQGWLTVEAEREFSRPLFHAAYQADGRECPPTVAP
jgi:hypothetical protein